MTMPVLGGILWRERFFDLTVEQVARFESLVVKEVLANQQFMKQLEGKLGEIQKSTYGKGAQGE
jgi:hypothetical protein